MTAEPWFAAYERAAFDENGKLRRYAQPPDFHPAVSLVKLRPRRTIEEALPMPPLRALWLSLRDLIGGPR